MLVVNWVITEWMFNLVDVYENQPPALIFILYLSTYTHFLNNSCFISLPRYLCPMEQMWMQLTLVV